MTLQEAAQQADELAAAGDERGLATLRQQWDEELEHAARNTDYRVRAQAYRAIAQFRFRQKLELRPARAPGREPGRARLGVDRARRRSPATIRAT